MTKGKINNSCEYIRDGSNFHIHWVYQNELFLRNNSNYLNFCGIILGLSVHQKYSTKSGWNAEISALQNCKGEFLCAYHIRHTQIRKVPKLESQ